MAKSAFSTEELGTAPLKPLLARLAIPSILAQVVNMMYNLVDRIYIGHIPEVGALALTGVGICLPLILAITSFGSLVGMGGAPYASILMGKGRTEDASDAMGTCFFAQFIGAVVLTVIALLFCEPLLFTFGASENTIVYATQYMSIYAFGTLFVQIAVGMNSFISGQGYAGASMATTCIGAVINIILDPIFIFGLGWGVRGAAWATVLSQGVSAVWVLQFLSSRKSELRLTRKNFRFHWQLLKPCLQLGLSPFTMQFTESALSACFNLSLYRYGGDMAVGAMVICNSVMQYANLPPQGLTRGAQPIISYSFGARRMQRVRQIVGLQIGICVACTAAVWVLCMLLPAQLIGVFTDDTTLIAYSVPMLRIYMAVSCLFGLQIACQNTFMALGNAKTSFFLAALRKLILLIPLIFILPHFIENQTMAVFLAEPVADFFAVGTTVVMFYYSFRALLRETLSVDGV